MEAAILKPGLQRIAVVQPLPGIGDMIWHLPHIRAIAAAAGRPVTVVAKPRSAADQLLGADPAVADVFWVDRNPDRGIGRHDGVRGQWQLIRDLRWRRFDAVVLLHHSHTLAASAMLAGIPNRYGYGYGRQRWFLNRGPCLPQACLPWHPFDQATEYLRLSGIPMAESEPRLSVGAAERIELARRLDGKARPYITIGLGSSEPYKQWGADRFAGLVIGLAEAGWRTMVLVGGPAERELAEAILSRVALAQTAARTATVMPAIAWDLTDLAALFEAAAFYVGNDTGVMNMAAASAIPTFGLFGGTAPFQHASHLVPVMPPDGRADKARGMASITVAAVLHTIALNRGSLAPEPGPLPPPAEASPPCPLCARPSRCLVPARTGYQAPSQFRIQGCDVCDVQFAWPATVPADLYDHIYHHVAVMPGYARYHRLANRITAEPEPLNWLASQEDVYWFVAQTLRTLGIGGGDAVFEVGCGLGYLTYALRQAGIAATGLDISATAVAAATERFGPWFRTVNAGELANVAPHGAAAVILTELIEHLADPAALLAEIAGMLAPGGVALVTTPNKSAARLGAVWDTENPPVHLWWFSETAMRVLADSAGLKMSLFDFSEFNASRIAGLEPLPADTVRPAFLDAAGEPLVLQESYAVCDMTEDSDRYRNQKANLAAQRSDCMGVILQRRNEIS